MSRVQSNELVLPSVRILKSPIKQMVVASASLDTLCINSIRMLAVDAVNKSKSGHPGLPMGCAPMGYALWDKFLNHNLKSDFNI